MPSAICQDHERVAEIYDQRAPVYDETFRNWESCAENDVIFSHLERRGLDTGRILDVGCGTGLLLDYLPQIGPENYLGVDISEGMIAEAEAKHDEHTFYLMDMMDAAKMACLGREFDVALCLFGSFCHVSNPRLALRLMLERLKPGGRFFLMLYGRRYLQRQTRIVGEEDFSLNGTRWSPSEAHCLLQAEKLAYGWNYWGFNRFAERLPERLMYPYLRAEYALTKQGWFLNSTYWICIEGQVA